MKHPKLLSKAQLAKRLQALEARSRRDLAKRARSWRGKPGYEHMRSSIARELANPLQSALSLRFYKRLILFKNYKGFCTFDPLTGLGHSYNWYEITKLIKGKLVLNTYAYSNQTVKHRNKLQALFKALKLPYIEIEAPGGLQNSKTAVAHAKQRYADELVRNKYARIKSEYHKHLRRMLDITCTLYGAPKRKGMHEALERAESARSKRLERARAERCTIHADASETDRAKPGLHIEHDSYLSRYRAREFKREALAKGFRHVYLHAPSQPQALPGGAS